MSGWARPGYRGGAAAGAPPGPTAGSPAGQVAGARRRRAARTVAVSAAAGGVCLLLLGAALSTGDVTVPVPDVARSLAGVGDGGYDYIVTQLRLPRALVAVMAGAAFGLGGAIFQSLIRNPLASPDIIGVTAGASAAAVTVIVVAGASGLPVSVAAFAGALAVAALMYVLAWRDGVTGYRLVLVGIGVAALMTSVVSYGLTRSEVHDARAALHWVTGSLNARTWQTVSLLGWSLAVLAPPALRAGRWLRALQVGDEAARAHGVPVERVRLGLLGVATGLTAVATAAVGPVAFVAFMSAPVARRLVGHGSVGLVPAAMVGAALLTGADLVAQHALPATPLPVGVVTALVGAPYLLYLLAVANRAGWEG